MAAIDECRARVHSHGCQVAQATKFRTVAPDIMSACHPPGALNSNVAAGFLGEICETLVHSNAGMITIRGSPKKCNRSLLVVPLRQIRSHMKSLIALVWAISEHVAARTVAWPFVALATLPCLSPESHQ